MRCTCQSAVGPGVPPGWAILRLRSEPLPSPPLEVQPSDQEKRQRDKLEHQDIADGGKTNLSEGFKEIRKHYFKNDVSALAGMAPLVGASSTELQVRFPVRAHP